MTATVRRRLVLQGFACDDDQRIACAAPWLRLTPALSTLCSLAGTALRSPLVLWAFALVAAAGLLFMSGVTTAGIVVGTLLAGASATVATTQFRLGSWLYHVLWRRANA